MSTLLLILLILVVLNAAGGNAFPAYGGYTHYSWSWPGLLVVILVLYLLGVR